MRSPRGSGPGASDGLAILILVLVTLPPRLLGLAADPPGDLPTDWFFDEGWWAHNARNLVLFGRWIVGEHNPAVFLTPLYSGALAVIYRLLGVGLAQTRLLSAISGFLTCLLVYLILRRCRSPLRALAPALGLGLAYPMLVMNRVGYTESFQLLLVTATFGASLTALDRPRWAFFTGLLFGCSLLAKPSAAIMAPVVLIFWSRPGRGQEGSGWRLRRRLIVPFALGTGLVAAAFFAVITGPLWSMFRAQLGTTVANVLEPGRAGVGNGALLGWHGVGLPINWLFLRTAVPVAVVALALAARLCGPDSRQTEPAEAFCWIWLAVGAGLAVTMPFLPSRRFVFLLPPLSVLATNAVFDRRLRLHRQATDPPPTTGAVWLAAAVLGITLGYYLHPLVLAGIRGLGTPPYRGVDGLTALATAGVAILSAVVWAVSLRTPDRTWTVPMWLPIAAFLVTDVGRFAAYAVHPSYSVRNAARVVDQIAPRELASAPVAIGNAAATISLETRLLPVALWRRSSGDPWTRYRPTMLLNRRGRGLDSLATAHGLGLCRTFHLVPDRAGHARMTVDLYTEPGRCPSVDSSRDPSR